MARAQAAGLAIVLLISALAAPRALDAAESEPETPAATPRFESAETGRTPETNYQLHCQGCHRPDGSGVSSAVPDLRGHVSVFLGSPDGRAFLVQVPGSANAPLSDRELAELLVWMVHHFDPGHVPADFAPYTAAEVGELRARRLSKVGETRAAILAALSK